MSSTNNEEIPKAALKNKRKVKQTVELNTTEEFLSQGTEEEESGDRFTLSDLSKSLRFYQKAYEYYLQAASLATNTNSATSSNNGNSSLLLDSVYNSSRLVFHVYNQYVKPNVINFNIDLKSIDNVVNSTDSILQPLPQILQRHLQAIQLYRQLGIPKSKYFPWDLYYNTCLVYTELIEDATEEDVPVSLVEEYINSAVQLFMEILEYQVSELASLLDDLNGVKSSSSNSSNSDNDVAGQQLPQDSQIQPDQSSNDEEYSSQEAIVPSTVLETINSAYSLIQAVYETANLNPLYQMGLSGAINDEIKQFVTSVEPILNDLMQKFGVVNGDSLKNTDNSNSNSESDSFFQPLEQKDLLNIELVKTAINGLLVPINSVDQLISLWSNKLQNDTSITSANEHAFPEIYSLVADNFQNYYDKHSISGAGIGTALDVSLHWNLLSTIGQYYKKSQDLYVALLKETQQKTKQNANNSVLISPLVSQIGLLLISRADIDVQRIHHPQFSQFAAKLQSEEILKRNIAALLKNALVYLNTDCGLREKIFDKLSRRQKRYLVLARQFILGLVPNLSARNEQEKVLIKAEVEALKELDAYNGFKFP